MLLPSWHSAALAPGDGREERARGLHSLSPWLCSQRAQISSAHSLFIRVPHGPNATWKWAVSPPTCLGIQGGGCCRGGQWTKLGVGQRTWLSLGKAAASSIFDLWVKTAGVTTCCSTRWQALAYRQQRLLSKGQKRWSSSHLEVSGSQRDWTGSCRVGACLLWTFSCSQDAEWEKEWVAISNQQNRAFPWRDAGCQIGNEPS